jgi:hypothetical protein
MPKRISCSLVTDQGIEHRATVRAGKGRDSGRTVLYVKPDHRSRGWDVALALTPEEKRLLVREMLGVDPLFVLQGVVDAFVDARAELELPVQLDDIAKDVEAALARMKD